MRWLLTFLAGALVGAIALFAWLYKLPGSEPPTPAVAAAPALPAPPASGGATLEGQLPPPPKVEPDLVDADLPLKPDANAATVAQVPDVAAPGAAAASQAKLLVPVQGIRYNDLSDNYNQPRGKERHHEALDIMAPRGTPVLAVADGKVVKLFNSKPGGITLYQFDPSEKYAYYYAHLDRYADGIKEGMQVKRGELIGYVGSTGNADPNAPHLHFAVVELTPEKQWWKGTPVNPYPLMGD
ncbi:MAG TPA: M23 family metallopeptidase [Telluria sp.]|nr:M23 family metallopeptidase [Telluria sp.]